MPSINVEIGDEMEAAIAMAKFRRRCACLDITDRQQIVQDVESVTYDLQSRGKELASIGSQFRTVKVLNLPSCNVKITASYGIPIRKSPVTWLRSLFRKR